ncbi:hypothetical protein BDW59DRAFT_164385 [Aspergillus cavernicola]|uniref:Uncharacterized protein n=1 Tax=Aspergillus cavernicola TaxID=176166 RepID=A0ABR4HZR0_9EURO
MSCTTLTNLCPECTKEYTAIGEKYPDYTIALKPNIYPVAFRGKFPESEVPFDYSILVANSIEHSLQQIFGEPVPVLAFSSFDTEATLDSEIWASFLIEFPVEDDVIIQGIFGGIEDSFEGLECLVPDGCPTAFFLRWHKDPME